MAIDSPVEISDGDGEAAAALDGEAAHCVIRGFASICTRTRSGRTLGTDLRSSRCCRCCRCGLRCARACRCDRAAPARSARCARRRRTRALVGSQLSLLAIDRRPLCERTIHSGRLPLPCWPSDCTAPCAVQSARITATARPHSHAIANRCEQGQFAETGGDECAAGAPLQLSGPPLPRQITATLPIQITAGGPPRS